MKNIWNRWLVKFTCLPPGMDRLWSAAFLSQRSWFRGTGKLALLSPLTDLMKSSDVRQRGRIPESLNDCVDDCILHVQQAWKIQRLPGERLSKSPVGLLERALYALSFWGRADRVSWRVSPTGRVNWVGFHHVCLHQDWSCKLVLIERA